MQVTLSLEYLAGVYLTQHHIMATDDARGVARAHEPLEPVEIGFIWREALLGPRSTSSKFRGKIGLK